MYGTSGLEHELGNTNKGRRCGIYRPLLLYRPRRFRHDTTQLLLHFLADEKGAAEPLPLAASRRKGTDPSTAEGRWSKKNTNQNFLEALACTSSKNIHKNKNVWADIIILDETRSHVHTHKTPTKYGTHFHVHRTHHAAGGRESANMHQPAHNFCI